MIQLEMMFNKQATSLNIVTQINNLMFDSEKQYVGTSKT